MEWNSGEGIRDCGPEGYAWVNIELKGVPLSPLIELSKLSDDFFIIRFRMESNPYSDLSIAFFPKQHASIKALIHLETPLLVRSTVFRSNPYDLRY